MATYKDSNGHLLQAFRVGIDSVPAWAKLLEWGGSIRPSEITRKRNPGEFCGGDLRNQTGTFEVDGKLHENLRVGEWLIRWNMNDSSVLWNEAFIARNYVKI